MSRSFRWGPGGAEQGKGNGGINPKREIQTRSPETVLHSFTGL